MELAHVPEQHQGALPLPAFLTRADCGVACDRGGGDAVCSHLVQYRHGIAPLPAFLARADRDVVRDNVRLNLALRISSSRRVASCQRLPFSHAPIARLYVTTLGMRRLGRISSSKQRASSGRWPREHAPIKLLCATTSTSMDFDCISAASATALGQSLDLPQEPSILVYRFNKMP
eukprot:CAMPEP_0117546508 /NCGR_PEP_ID=MMETSP0784-20121206/46642_1 /TAXON_ID=39447 /ORGANISM="" /LENGTH=174 /DNA_ID=CAMNT_0005343379 /DNA_START=593 /DNA_END=1115 /DNA_ORIENTATION=-